VLGRGKGGGEVQKLATAAMCVACGFVVDTAQPPDYEEVTRKKSGLFLGNRVVARKMTVGVELGAAEKQRSGQRHTDHFPN
jgi:hypothetical protein